VIVCSHVIPGRTKMRIRNREILRSAIAHLGSMLRIATE
jgi:hypothetical protein